MDEVSCTKASFNQRIVNRTLKDLKKKKIKLPDFLVFKSCYENEIYDMTYSGITLLALLNYKAGGGDIFNFFNSLQHETVNKTRGGRDRPE